ncbi:MAG: AAA family ATPase [Succinivibrio sp.]|nr:AAA family ATPase [Succinivibrio sp.]
MIEQENSSLFFDTPEFKDQYVFLSIWIATALMSYEKYQELENGSKNISSDDMWFKQQSIISRAEQILSNNGLSNKVDQPRVSLWTVEGKSVKGKEVNHYFLINSEQKGSLRRLNLIDDSSEKTFPKSFIEKYGNREVSLSNGKKISINALSDFVKTQFKELCKEESMSSFTTLQTDKSKKLEFDKNIILFGPPGTGKTYNSIIYAVAICDNRTVEDVRKDDYLKVLERYHNLCKEDRIAFTTFHQSYGYEEFIEGIKPNIEDGSSDVTYEKKSGIFKLFCEKAGNKKISANNNNLNIKENPTVWKISLEGAGNNKTKRDCFENGRIRIGWTKLDKHVTEDSNIESSGVRRILNNFEYSMEEGDLVVVLKDQRSIDAIGVIAGPYEWLENVDSYKRSRKVKWLATDIDEDIYSLNHNKVLVQQTVYRLNVDADEILKLARKNNPSLAITVQEEDKPYVFIIDEINRGNISKIFGELITLIETSKRGLLSAKLPYSGDDFTVPANVYIIGTMNTADRSISLMDTALRRRFSFIEMLPDEELLQRNNLNVDLVDVSKMLRTINKRIECLFDREHTIGHAFFMELKENRTISKLSEIFKKSVIPLLQEYFYEDYNKIMLVLGDNYKSNKNYQFIKKVYVKARDIFKGNDSEIDLPECTYEINQEAFLHIESYIEIYKTVEQADNKQ